MITVMMIKCSSKLIYFTVYFRHQRVITTYRMMTVIKYKPIDSHIYDDCPRQVKGGKFQMEQGLGSH